MWSVHKLALVDLCYTLTLPGYFTFYEEFERCLVMQSLLPQCQVSVVCPLWLLHGNYVQSDFSVLLKHLVAG